VSAAPLTYTYKRAGGCDIKADVYLPAAGGPRPALLWIHGGALIMGGRRDVRGHQQERYLAAGYTVVSADYRLAPETKLPEIIDDIRDAFHWVRESGPSLFNADARRIGVVGHSAGGYLTLMSGFCTDPRPQALVSFYGYGDLVGPWYSEPSPFYCRQPAVSEAEARSAVGASPLSEGGGENRGRFYLYCRQRGLWPKEVSGRDPSAAPGFFRAYCPDQNVDSVYPPTLLLHGDQDTDVPYELSVAMARALASAGVEHELITIPDGGHGFDWAQDEAASQAFERVLAFLGAYLRPSS
jgi:acetyl esterase/lipase